MQTSNRTKLTLIAMVVLLVSAIISISLLVATVVVSFTNSPNVVTEYKLPPNQLEIYKENLLAYQVIPGPGEYHER